MTDIRSNPRPFGDDFIFGKRWRGAAKKDRRFFFPDILAGMALAFRRNFGHESSQRVIVEQNVAANQPFYFTRSLMIMQQYFHAGLEMK
jgi:hypothetical protein